jgi:hypothetical protein
MMAKASSICSKDTGLERNPADEVEVRGPDDSGNRYLSEDEPGSLHRTLDETKHRKGLITACKQDGQSVGSLANEIEVNRNFVLSFPEHEARVLEAPLNIRNDELRLRRCFRSIHVNMHRNR